ncbi:hypothetical protein A2U01_0059945, partial [Trifolium medium]|nr:hypothetical protein [Trifolium medium]
MKQDSGSLICSWCGAQECWRKASSKLLVLGFVFRRWRMARPCWRNAQAR